MFSNLIGSQDLSVTMIYVRANQKIEKWGEILEFAFFKITIPLIIISGIIVVPFIEYLANGSITPESFRLYYPSR